MKKTITFLSRRAAMLLLVMMLTTATAWAGTVDVTVNVTGSGSVSIGNQAATAGNPFTTSVDDGASVTLTFAPDAGNIVTGAKLSYKYNEHGTAVKDIAISGSTATFQMPNDIWNGTGVTINVTFGDGLIGGADEASAVALTDATVSNLAGGYYKVESDISFDHTLNLIGDTYLVIASGAKMTVSSSENGINGESYALNVLGEGTLNVTTTGSYKIAVYVSSYTQLGCSVNLTTTYFGMRCSDSFNISGGSFKTNGSKGIYPDNNAVNISGGKLEASNIDANISLSYSNTDDYIKVDNYTSGKTMTIANGQTFTDGTTNYSGTITNLSPLNGKKLFPFVYIHLTLRDATCTEVGIKQECWQRSSDGKYFSDENGTNELNASDVETPMIPHTGVHHDATDTHIEYWQCSVCGKYFSNSGCTTEITEEDTKFYRTITIDNGISGLVTSNVDKAVAGTTVTLTVSHLIDTSTLQVNSGSVALTDAGNGTYTFTVPAADVTVTASTATTYSVNLPANMEIVSATNTADGSGKYISGTVVTFKASFSYTASNVYDGANTLTADDSGNYSVTVGTADITVTATIEHSSNIDLSQAPSDFTVVDGDVLTGSTSHTVSIANGASITLNDATITGGIVCNGTATITLVGTNSVTGLSRNISDPNTNTYNSAGIQIGGEGTTLTIRGNGSLTATGGSQSAGIGVRSALSNYNESDVSGGNIVIEGGNIVAQTSGYGAAGIGTGCTLDRISSIGTITIKGGTVTATGGTDANGIGNGDAYGVGGTSSVGTITFYDSIDLIDASSISDFGSVVYMHGETDVTASKTDYFAIVEDGDRRIIAPKDDTDYTITIANGIEHGTLTGAATAKFGDNVTITATPALGYRFSRLVVKDAQNNDVESTANSFFMPKSNVTVSAVFEQGVHGTTEFAWGYYEGDFVKEATIYDGLTTVNLQQGKEYNIGKDYYEFEPGKGYCDNTFRLDEDPNAEGRDIPYSGGTGIFQDADGTRFRLNNDGEAGFYDITMTDVGNGKWNVSILKTAGQMDVVPDQTYTGSAITPEPTVIAGSFNLTKGTDYDYSYTNNTNVGTATVRATFQGLYAWLGSVEKEFTILPSTVIVNVTGNGTVTYNDKVATNGEVIGVLAEKGTDVTLTFAPENGYAVSVAYGYTNNSGTTAIGLKLPISGTTATLTVPNDLKDGTYVNLTVTFVSALVGGADEASAVALTDNTVTNFGGGWYKVENDISFDHTLNLLADTYLTIAEGKTMTVNTATSKGILSDYTLFVSGEGTLSVTTTKAYEIAVRVGSYVQTGATVTANGYIGIRCTDNFDEFNVTNDFTFSGGQLTATGSGGDGIWADNDITLSCTNATDFIQASSYSSVFGAVKIADGKALTDGTEASNGMNGYSGTLTNEQRTAIGGKTLHRAVTTSYVDASGTLHENVIAIPLDNTMTTLAAGWYVVNSDVTFSGDLSTDADGEVNIILCDGATLTANNITPIGNSDILRIYGQSQSTGTANISGRIEASSSLQIYGGTINVTGNIVCDQSGVGIHGGNVTAAKINGYEGSLYLKGGTITAGSLTIDHGDIKLGGATVTAGSYNVTEGNVTILTGITYYDGTGASYTAGNLSADQISAIAGEKLRTYDYRTVSYVKADGTTATADAIPLTGGGATTLAGGWYVVNSDVTYTGTVTLAGDVNIILADGKTMSVGTEQEPISGDGIVSELDNYTLPLYALTIYGQSTEGNNVGALKAYSSGDNHPAVYMENYTQYGGDVTASGDYGIETYRDVTIYGGTATVTGSTSAIVGIHFTMSGGNLDVTGDISGGDFTMSGGTATFTGYILVSSKVTFSGGNLTVNEKISAAEGTINLGWSNASDRIYASWYDSTVKIAAGKRLVYTDGNNVSHILGGNNMTILTTDEKTAIAGKTLTPAIVLADNADNADNTSAIATAVTLCTGGKTLAVQLSGRTLYKDGYWNTLCLPFDVSDFTGTPLEGATVKELDTETEYSGHKTGLDGTTLYLYFKDATKIDAGKPYIIKWASGDNLVNPVFTGVTVSNAKNDVAFTGGSFKGNYDPLEITAATNRNSIVVLAGNNRLGYVTTDRTIENGKALGAFHAYFEIPADNGQGAREFVLNADDESTQTGIGHTEITDITENSGAWYTLDGRKLDGKPTQKGIYIYKGKKVKR